MSMLTNLNNLFISMLEERPGELPWWAWLLIILVIILLLVIWWWLGRRSRMKGKLPAEPVKPAVKHAQQPAAPVKPDDLKVIEGIGPKISSVLQAAGLATFKQLAGADVSHLDQILKNEGLRLADPSTWPDQAKLAAEGKWEQLKTLQDSLKGGRRL
jgi:predicted flap endonuclease-1-like 5' DNA nuclease